jgi:death-on-curing protein
MTWRWVSKEALLLLHGESLAEHGGRSGLREPGLLDSALNRPLNLLAYGEPDASDLASSYATGIVKNHPFIDGGKRAAFLSVGMFLHLNGYRLQATQTDATLAMWRLAEGVMTEAEFATWLRAHCVRRDSPQKPL